MGSMVVNSRQGMANYLGLRSLLCHTECSLHPVQWYICTVDCMPRKNGGPEKFEEVRNKMCTIKIFIKNEN